MSIPPAASSPPAPAPAVARPDRAVEAGRGALFIGFAKVFFMVSGFLQRWLLTRFVGPAEYGAFSVVNNAVSTINNTVVQSTIHATSKFTAESDAQAESVKAAGLKMQAGLGVIIGAGFWLAAPFTAQLVRAPDYVGWFRIVAAIPFLYGFYSVFVGSANGLRRFRTQASFDVGFSILKTILVLGGALALRSRGGSVTGAFAGFVAAAVLILLFAARTMGLPPRQSGASFPVARLLVFMGGVFAYTLLINLALNYDLLLLRRFAGGLTHDAEAGALAGQYEALRNLALLPYQALLVVTFVIFPLVSRSTFERDREATQAYVRQTLRVALIFAAGMGVALGARPVTVLSVLYKPEYLAGAQALPVLVAGICCLALLAVMCAIINASGRPRAAVVLVGSSVVAGSAAALLWARHAAPGPDLLRAMALATAFGMAVGFAAGVAYLWRRFGAAISPRTALRVLLAVVVACAVGRLLPGHGKLMGLIALGLATLVYGLVLVLTGEIGPTDRAQLVRIVRRDRRAAHS